MRFRAIFVFILIGTSISFAGLPVRDVARQQSSSEEQYNQVTQALDDVIVLVYLLSILGVATILLIRIFEIVTGLDLINQLIYHSRRHTKVYYPY